MCKKLCFASKTDKLASVIQGQILETKSFFKMRTKLGFLAPVAPLGRRRKRVVDSSQRAVMSIQPSRRQFTKLAASMVVLSIPGASYAMSREEAEREARLAYASLTQLSDLVDLRDYNGFRMQLRTGAMSRVRASCTAWYRSFEPSDKRAVTGEKMYRGLIKAVEAADLAALKAERGGDGRNIQDLVRSIGLRFDEFLRVVGE